MFQWLFEFLIKIIKKPKERRMPADNTTVIMCNYILVNILWGEEFDIKPESLDTWRDEGSRSLTDKGSRRTARRSSGSSQQLQISPRVAHPPSVVTLPWPPVEISLLCCSPGVLFGWLNFSVVYLTLKGHSSLNPLMLLAPLRKSAGDRVAPPCRTCFRKRDMLGFFLIFIDMLAKCLWHRAVRWKTRLGHTDPKHFLFRLLLWSAFSKAHPSCNSKDKPRRPGLCFSNYQVLFFLFYRTVEFILLSNK